MNSVQIDQYFETYCNNMKRKRRLAEELMNTGNREEWKKALENRALEQRQMYRENNQIILEASECLLHIRETMDEEMADACYRGVAMMSAEATHDYSMIVQAIEPLLDFYVQRDDVNKLIYLYYLRFYEMEEMLSRGMNPYSPRSMWSDQEAILQFKDLYVTRLADLSRWYIFAVYFNLIVVGVDTKYLNEEQSCHYLKEMLAFWNSKEVQELDGQKDYFKQMIERTQIEWLAILENSRDLPESVQQFFLELSDRFYQKEQDRCGEVCRMQYEIVASHIHAEVIRGKCTWEEALTRYIDYYEVHCDYLRSEAFQQYKSTLQPRNNAFLDYLIFYVNAPGMMEKWIRYHGIRSEIYASRVNQFMIELDARWEEIYHYLPAPYLDEKIFEWCFYLIPCVGDEIEQEKWIKKAVMRRHITTYIHSRMVERLCEIIATHIMDKKPDLLQSIDGVHGMSLQHDRDEIIHFIKKAGLYHDIGKNRIAEAIDTQTRRLTDGERSMIRLHPEYGHRLIQNLEMVKPFDDVIQGHHKYYNGKGGYPIAFDNTKSPIKVVIDIVSICDTIDAMTDPIGRNYAHARKFGDFLRELKQEKGTRYHPGIADFMLSDDDLIRELTDFTTEGRTELIYQIYDQITD